LQVDDSADIGSQPCHAGRTQVSPIRERGASVFAEGSRGCATGLVR
jgi:hypothetical protein